MSRQSLLQRCSRIAAFLALIGLSGCATMQGASGVQPLWPQAMPDYTAPAEPQVAPPPAGGCAAASALPQDAVAPCTGVLVPAERLQFMLDEHAQREPILGLLTSCAAGRAADREYAQTMYEAAQATALAERRGRLRTGLNAFAAGAGVGAGAITGLLLAIFLSR